MAVERGAVVQCFLGYGVVVLGREVQGCVKLDSCVELGRVV